MAKHAGRASQGNIQLASVDPTATPDAAGQGKDTGKDLKGEEPFGLFTFVAPDSIVWFKWRKVAADIRAQEPALLRCLSDATACSPAAARFAAIVSEAREHEGRVRLNFVNQRVNNAIRYTSDMTQWTTPDEWSAPFAGGKGSFETGLGDCEDYAIAKYVALRAAGVPARHLRVLLVRDNIARLDHAVLAANDDGRWFMLDNRWTAAVEDNEVRRFTPLFALDDQGVKLLAVPYAESKIEPRIQPMSEAVKGGKGDQAQQSSPGGITPSACAGRCCKDAHPVIPRDAASEPGIQSRTQCMHIVRSQCLYLDPGSGVARRPGARYDRRLQASDITVVMAGLSPSNSLAVLRAHPVHGDACHDKQIGIFVGAGYEARGHV